MIGALGEVGVSQDCPQDFDELSRVALWASGCDFEDPDVFSRDLRQR